MKKVICNRVGEFDKKVVECSNCEHGVPHDTMIDWAIRKNCTDMGECEKIKSACAKEGNQLDPGTDKRVVCKEIEDEDSKGQ